MKNRSEQEKRRQAKLKRRKKNRGTYQAPPLQAPMIAPKIQLPIELNLWLSCAINYLASDFETGVWEPLWSDHGKGPFPERVRLFEAVHNRYWDTESQSFQSRLGSVLAGWTMIAEKTIFGLQLGYLQWMTQAQPDKEPIAALLTPHDADVWNFFQTEIRQKLLATA